MQLDLAMQPCHNSECENQIWKFHSSSGFLASQFGKCLAPDTSFLGCVFSPPSLTARGVAQGVDMHLVIRWIPSAVGFLLHPPITF